MATTIKTKGLVKLGYNFDALKFFLEKAYEIKVNDVRVIVEGYGFRANKDLIIDATFPAGNFICVLRKENEDDNAWVLSNLNSVNPRFNYISNTVIRAIYPTKNSVSKYDIVKKIDSIIASGALKGDSLYIDNICETIEYDDVYNFDMDGAKMMERDIALLVDFASEYAKTNAESSDYKYDMLKDSELSDDDKLNLLLEKNGIASGSNAELMEVEKFINNLPKNLAKNSEIDTTKGITYTFKSNGCTFTTNLN